MTEVKQQRCKGHSILFVCLVVLVLCTGAMVVFLQIPDRLHCPTNGKMHHHRQHLQRREACPPCESAVAPVPCDLTELKTVMSELLDLHRQGSLTQRELLQITTDALRNITGVLLPLNASIAAPPDRVDEGLHVPNGGQIRAGGSGGGDRKHRNRIVGVGDLDQMAGEVNHMTSKIDAIYQRSQERLAQAERAERERLSRTRKAKREKEVEESKAGLAKDGVGFLLDQTHSAVVVEQAVEIDPWDIPQGVYMWDWFPATHTCTTRERVGRVGDGGKWMCDIEALRAKTRGGDNCVVYSYGVRDDVSFETELVRRTGCTVHAFDPTVPGLPVEGTTAKHITFHKQALSGKSGPTKDFLNTEGLADTMARLGHSYLDILKVDIEGAEWDVFKSILGGDSPRGSLPRLPVGQLLIELHFHNASATFDFFRNMHRDGFRVFSQETNFHPCVAPGNKKPVAVEFSFLRPDSQALQKSVLAVLPEEPKKEEGAIFTLIHGNSLKRLPKMLSSLDLHFNDRYGYPVVLFTEKVSEAQKNEIRRLTRSRLVFHDVEFSLPASLDLARVRNQTECSTATSTVGYRHMCRFNAATAHDLLSEMGYKWHWRMDDDSRLTGDIGYDIFRFMAQNKMQYGFINTVQDSPPCVKGLWEAAETFRKDLNLTGTFFDEWPAGQVFYNNFEISHTSLWQSTVYTKWFAEVERLGGIYYTRWGDAPIKSIGVSLVVPPEHVHRFSDVGYTHLPFAQQEATGLPSPGLTLFDVEQGSNSTNSSSGSVLGVLPGRGNRMVSTRAPDAEVPPSKAALLTIIQGDNTTSLLAMLRSFDRHFNQRLGYRYPAVIFCEGVSDEAKRRISNATRTRVLFYDLQFKLPTSLNITRDPAANSCAKQSSLGFRHMSRFLALKVHRVASALGFEWHWLLHSDSLLTAPIEYDIFDFMARSNKRYGYIAAVPDNPACIEGLWSTARTFVARHGGAATFLEDWPEGRVFYNNFEVSHASVWEGEYASWMNEVDATGAMYRLRWSSSAVTTVGLALSLPAEDIQQFRDVGYTHEPFVKQQGGGLAVAAERLPLARKVRGLTYKAGPADALQPLFERGRSSAHSAWSGGDVASSLTLGRGRSLWMFGDTVLSRVEAGQRKGTTLIHGSLALVRNGTGASPEIEWITDVRGMISPPCAHRTASEPFFWIISGLLVDLAKPRQRYLVFMAQRVRSAASFNGMFDFEVLGTTAFVVSNPDSPPSDWTVTRRDVPGTNATHNWFSGLALASGEAIATSGDEEVVLVGSSGNGLQTFDTQTFARLPVNELIALDFGSLRPWQPLTQPPALGQPLHGSPAMGWAAQSELSLHYHRHLGFWYSLSVDVARAQVLLHSAPRLEGPWLSDVVYSLPAPWDRPAAYYAYAAKAHPEMASLPAEIVFTYIVNTKQGVSSLDALADAVVYSPRFVRLLFDPDGEIVEIIVPEEEIKQVSGPSNALLPMRHVPEHVPLVSDKL